MADAMQVLREGLPEKSSHGTAAAASSEPATASRPQFILQHYSLAARASAVMQA